MVNHLTPLKLSSEDKRAFYLPMLVREVELKRACPVLDRNQFQIGNTSEEGGQKLRSHRRKSSGSIPDSRSPFAHPPGCKGNWVLFKATSNQVQKMEIAPYHPVPGLWSSVPSGTSGRSISFSGPFFLIHLEAKS